MTTLLDGGSPGTRPGGQPGPAAEQADRSAQELLEEMAALLRDSRPGLLAGMAALAAMTVGLAVEVTAFSAVPRSTAAMCACAALFTIAALCWLRAAAMFMLSGVPLGHALGRLRAHTGAPLDPRARWAGLAPGTDGGWTWAHAHLMVGQARFRYERIQHAMAWTVVTGVVFLACSAALLFTR